MAVFQISKIQVSTGVHNDLPGAPTSLNPPVFAPGLDPGEFGFTTDDGRLFIGHDPVSGQVSYQRTSYPYQNVEVLTENSTDAFKRMFANNIRQDDHASFFTATVAASGAWNTVLVGQPPREFTFDASSFMASIQYALSTTEGVAQRIGELRIVHVGSGSSPTISDDHLSAPSMNNDIEFRLMLFAGAEPHYALQYRNTTGNTSFLRFRVTYLTALVEP